jgi:hypothetical protein
MSEKKILWSSVSIRVPSEFITVDKNGKVNICPPLTKSGNVSKRNKKPSINIVSDDSINKVQIQNEGEYRTKSEPKSEPKETETMHQKMARLRSMRKTKIKTNPQEDKEQLEDRNKKSILNSFVSRVKTMNEDDRPTVLMKYNSMSVDLRDVFRSKYPNLYGKLNIKSKI